MRWEEVESEIKALAAKIKYKPEVIVGVVRGGLVPSRLMAKYLGVKNIYALTFKEDGDDRLLVSEIKEDLTGKRLLLVEDVLVTGKTLMAAKQYLANLQARVETAALYFLPQTEMRPDYYLGPKDKIPIFPWD